MAFVLPWPAVCCRRYRLTPTRTGFIQVSLNWSSRDKNNQRCDISEPRLHRIPPTVARKLGYYVYLYVDPSDGKVFYVGKGKNGRGLAHLREGKTAIAKRVAKIRSAGGEPQIEILAHGLGNPETALKLEAAAIDLLGLQNLANVVRGHGTEYGRLPLQEVVAHYTRRKATIREPTMLIRINREYRYGMTDVELYDATRSAWRVGERSRRVEYAFAVFEGVVREVYRIKDWLDGGSTFTVQRGGRAVLKRGRREFVGTLADDKIRKRYINRYVGHLFPAGARNPFKYVNLRKEPANRRLQSSAARARMSRRG